LRQNTKHTHSEANGDEMKYRVEEEEEDKKNSDYNSSINRLGCHSNSLRCIAAVVTTDYRL